MPKLGQKKLAILVVLLFGIGLITLIVLSRLDFPSTPSPEPVPEANRSQPSSNSASSSMKTASSTDDIPLQLPIPQDRCEQLMTFICQGRPRTRYKSGEPIAQTEVESELEVLREYESLVRANPEWTHEELDEALAKSVYTPERVQELTRAFDYSKAQIISFLSKQERQFLSFKAKTELTKIIKSVILDLPPPAIKYQQEPQLLTKSDVYFEKITEKKNITRRVRIGGAYAALKKNWPNLVFTMTHELAHSIDPCELKNQILRSSEWLGYQNLQECFSARKILFKPKVAQGTHPFCAGQDHLAEMFADWVAIEVLSHALRDSIKEFLIDPGLSAQEARKQRLDRAFQVTIGAVHDLCDPDEMDDELDLSQHPSAQTRMTEILGKHPVIRSILGCKSDLHHATYCSFSTFSNQEPNRGKPQ